MIGKQKKNWKKKNGAEKSKMNVILLTDDFYPNLGGVANVQWNIYKFFQNKEHKLLVFNPYFKCKNVFKEIIKKSYELKDLAHFLQKKKFYYYVIYSFWSVIKDNRTPFSHRLKILMYLMLKPKILMMVVENVSNLLPHLKKLKFDVVISGNSGRNLSLVYILSRIFNKKLITIAYGNDFLTRSSLSLKTFYFRNADKIILITYKTKELIKKIHHLDDDKLEVIHVGVDISSLEVKETKLELRKEFDIGEDVFMILSVGRHATRKNFQLVIKALDILVNVIYRPLKNKKYKYYLIGKNESQTSNLKQLTKDLKLEDQVTFLGRCDVNTRNKYYKMSDLFIMPSITKNTDIEGFGIVFLEANYFKVPVIGSATGGMTEAIIDGKTGFLIKQNDIIDLVDKITFLCNNELKRKEMGENGYYRVIKDFKWEKIIKNYIKLINEMIV